MSYLGEAEEIFGTMQNLEVGENIYDSSKNEVNTYINNANGNTIAYSGWNSSEYIDIGDYDKLMIVSDSNTFLTQWNAVYDENKNYIKGITLDRSKIENGTIGKVTASIDIIDVAENYKYLRISQVSSAMGKIKIYPINKDFNGLINFCITEDILETYDLGNNMFDFNTAITKTYINDKTGAEVSYSSWSSTDYIDISECNQIIIASFSSSAFSYYDGLYDENKNYVKNPYISSLATNYSSKIGYFKILNVPDNVHYIRISLATTSLKTIQVYPANIKDVVGDIKYKDDNIQLGESLFDINTVTKNIYIDSDGSIISYNGWSATDYVYIGGSVGTIIKNHSSEYNGRYNAEKQFVKNIDFNNTYIYHKALGKVGATLLYIEPDDNNQYIRLSQTNNNLKGIDILPVLNQDFDKHLNFILK